MQIRIAEWRAKLSNDLRHLPEYQKQMCKEKFHNKMRQKLWDVNAPVQNEEDLSPEDLPPPVA